jgi:predicted kinase
MKKPIAYILVGLPGSGKSSYLSNELRDVVEIAFVYSTDDYIEMVASEQGKTYNDVFSSKLMKEAEKYLEKRLKKAIEKRQDIIWDQTNLGQKKRQKIIQKLKGTHILRCIYFPITLEDFNEWQDRLENREGKKISRKIIMQMVESMNVPELEEGYNEIRYIHTFGTSPSNREWDKN